MQAGAVLRFASHSAWYVYTCMYVCRKLWSGAKDTSIYVDFKDLFSAAKELAKAAFDGIKSIF